MVDPAAPSCDTLMYSAVTVYPIHADQACTTRGLQKLFLRPARAFSTVKNVARPRISNWCSRISSILHENLHIEIEIDICIPRQIYVDNLVFRAF